MAPPSISITKTERLLPSKPPTEERIVALSLVDATTANFALTNAIWLFEKPEQTPAGFDLVSHLRQTLQTALSAYPQWTGQLKSVGTIDGKLGQDEVAAQSLPAHARRFGRVYAHFGTAQDPGVEFTVATSSITLDDLYSVTRPKDHPVWNRKGSALPDLMSSTAIASPLESNEPDEKGVRKPLLAVQITELAGGSFALAAKSAHPLADIAALVVFMKDWASLSRAVLTGAPEKELKPVFDPSIVDGYAAGDVNADTPDASILEKAHGLPLHRYDWWAPVSDAPWPVGAPEIFSSQDLSPAGKAMPWSEWNVNTPVASYIVHLTKEQVELLYRKAASGSSERISRHDAVLAHVWSCITRARNQPVDGPVHCDLVFGLRPSLGLGESFMGTPIIMINVELSREEVESTMKGSEIALQPISQRVRETINKVSQPADLGAHIYSIAFEKSPQRIWQAFLGTRHSLVTTWARAGLYDVNFGLGSIRYADGVVPAMDGNILIKEGPPLHQSVSSETKWTENGVDITIQICDDDMERLLKDPLLLP